MDTKAKDNLTRGQRLASEMRNRREKAQLSLWRSRLITASFKETEGLPIPVRRAKAFEKIVTEIPIFIDDEQLLVGDYSAKPLLAEWYPELGVSWVLKELEEGDEAYEALDEERAEQHDICEYWKSKSSENSILCFMSEKERERLFQLAENGANVIRMINQLDRVGAYNVPDYSRVIQKGIKGILADIEMEMRKTVLKDRESFEKTIFLQALCIACRATVRYGKRYAVLARELAKKAMAPRKVELEKIAEVCDWVPENPARTFHEAVQALWFVEVLLQLEYMPYGVSPGRTDQYLYPYYQRDIEEGRLTKEEAIELLECLRVKMSTLMRFRRKEMREATSAEAQYHNIVLGGQTSDGKDAVNDLSYLFLEAAFRTRTPHNTLSVRWHQNLSHDFFIRSLELASLGLGYPAFFGDNSNMMPLMHQGASLEEARDYSIGGCVLPMIAGKGGAVHPLFFNVSTCLILALHDGFDPRTKMQVGSKTGNFTNFKTYEDFWEAFKKQVKDLLLESVRIANIIRVIRELVVPPIFTSLLFEDCIKSGKSVLTEAPPYQNAEVNIRGQIDTVDSLAAIKKCVFEDRSVGKQELLDALDANFERYESVRQLLLSAPKYGNDDDYVDSIPHDFFDWWQHLVNSEADTLHGGKYIASAYSVSGHVSAGRKTGALPSGRLAWQSLADGGVSPCQGVDVKGPTAVIKSAGKIDQYPVHATLLNMKFTPVSLKTREDLEKLGALIRTYFNLGGKHIQFNVVDKETLLDAQIHPEHHRNLLIRVAGYSAYFVELDRGVQDEIIRRSQYML